eukprot:4112912-Prymnesium_polylepis.1
MASRGPLGHRAGSTQRGLQPRAVRGESSMETESVSMLLSSRRSSRPLNVRRVSLPKAALQSRWPAPSR